MRVVLVGALNGAFAVAAGAFGAHLLEGRITVADAEVWQTAVYYQAIHAALMVALGALKGHMLPGLLNATSWAIALGTILFCGSLYAVGLGSADMVGYIAPVGGALLLIGWLLLAIGAARRV